MGPEEVKSIGPVDMVFVALKTWQFKDIPDVKSLVCCAPVLASFSGIARELSEVRSAIPLPSVLSH